MNADQVTDEMEFRFNKRPCAKFEAMTSKQIIAAAVNAVRDESPITAEWLETIGKKDGCNGWYFCCDGVEVWVAQYADEAWRAVLETDGGYEALPSSIKSRHQLLCLLEGLGIGVMK